MIASFSKHPAAVAMDQSPDMTDAGRDTRVPTGHARLPVLITGANRGLGSVAARLFAGALPQLEAWRAAGHSLAIVSHKTRFAAQNAALDLHRATMAFLERHGVLARIPPEAVYFEETRQGKCRRIATLGCHVFIDDLPEVLTDQAFPEATRGVLFTSWAQAGAAVAALAGEEHGASGV